MPDDKPKITIELPTEDKEKVKKVIAALVGEDEPEPGGSGPKQPKQPGMGG